MLIKEFKAALPYLLKAKVNPLIWGHHAAAKTVSVSQFAKENNYGIFNLRLGNMADAGDMLGMADFVLDSKGNKIATKFFIPDYLKQANEFCEKNPDKYFLLFFDEVNRARKDIRVPLMQMVLDNKLHTYDLHPNIRFIGAANPPTDEYDVEDISDKAFISRWAHIKYTPSVQEWLDYQQARGMHSSFINFIRDQPKMLQKEIGAFNLDFVEPDRRNWELFDTLFKTEIPKDLLQEVGFGLVGLTATLAYLDSVKNADKPFEAKEIMSNYPKIKEKVKSLSLRNGETNTPLLDICCKNLQKEFEMREKNSLPVTEEEGKNTLEFLIDIPVGISFAAVRELWLIPLFRPFFEKDQTLANIFEKNKNKK